MGLDINLPFCADSLESTLADAGWSEAEPGIWRSERRPAEPAPVDILATLLDQPPWLEARLLYDATGSHLFEEICRLPEYYLTRAEQSILEASADRLVAAADSQLVVELGAGFSIKTRTLLRAQLERYRQTTFVPIDVSLTALRNSRRTSADFEALDFVALHGDSESSLKALTRHRKLVLFLGSSLGNFAGSDLPAFLASMQRSLLPGDAFLLGVDHVKSPDVIEAAYNDSAGLTEAFIRNSLRHLNRRLEADFDSDDFDYQARYSVRRQRVELELITRRIVRVTCRRPRATIDWPPGTPIRVEVSRKFDPDRLAQQVECFGFRLLEQASDPDDWFSLLLFEKDGGPAPS